MESLRCQDRNGSFMVETTAWEGEKTRDEENAKSEAT
jgi:hypothetical protein